MPFFARPNVRMPPPIHLHHTQCIHICTHTHLHTNLHIHAHVHTDARIPSHTVHTHAHTLAHACMRKAPAEGLAGLWSALFIERRFFEVAGAKVASLDTKPRPSGSSLPAAWDGGQCSLPGLERRQVAPASPRLRAEEQPPPHGKHTPRSPVSPVAERGCSVPGPAGPVPAFDGAVALTEAHTGGKGSGGDSGPPMVSPAQFTCSFSPAAPVSAPWKCIPAPPLLGVSSDVDKAGQG